jgi:hypothetical protein
LGGVGDGHDGVGQRVRPTQLVDQLAHRSCLAADAGIHADHTGAALVDDGVQRQAGFARAAIAKEEFALTQADRDRGVDHLDAGQQGLVDRSPVERTVSRRLRRASALRPRAVVGADARPRARAE